jgi:antitoxin (DNA-binding transcriptional repressor) of toxin-antitoxin stability system
MRQISLREFRTRGSKALEAVPQGEIILLSGQQGPAYFLVPVLGDVAMEDRELRRAMAKASLRESWLRAKATGSDQMTAGEIRERDQAGPQGSPTPEGEVRLVVLDRNIIVSAGIKSEGHQRSSSWTGFWRGKCRQSAAR